MKPLTNLLMLPAIFLDRDGVIIRKAPEGSYIARWDEVEFLPGALDAMNALDRAGFAMLIVTNQRGVATGEVNADDLDDIHQRMRTVLETRGIRLAGVYVCPHDIIERCECRKPKPGMLLEAAREHGIDLVRSWMIGDRPSDVAAGQAAGCRTVWITSSDPRGDGELDPDLIAPDLPSAVQQVLTFNGSIGRC